MPKDRPFAVPKRQPTPRPSNVRPRSTVLPLEVQRAVPQCAQECLAHSIDQQYNCPDNAFDCLCGRYSSDGFALGELAYLCLGQDCQQESKATQREAYFVCNSDPEAVEPTHSTLTVPASTGSELHTSAGSTHIRNHPSTLQTSLTSSATMAPSRSQTSAPPAAEQTQTSRPASSSPPTTHLTSAQSVGISIASMGTVILIIALIYLISCIQRRKVTHKDERKSYDFVDEAPPRFSPFNYGYADPRGPLGGFQLRRAELMDDKHPPNWAHSHYAPSNAQKHEMCSNDMSPNTYRSNDSKRSQLLPDKPYSTLFRSGPKTYLKSPASAATTIFEEDRPFSPPPPMPNLKPLPKLPPAGQTIHYPAPPPTKARMVQYAQQYQQKSPDKSRQPSLSLDIPRQATRLPRVPSPVAFQFPPSAVPPIPRGRDSSHESLTTKSRGSEGSLLNYYASPDAGFDSSPEDFDDPTTPIDEQSQRRKAIPNAITITKPFAPPRAVRVDSNGSDTSFESNLSNEPTPPEELDRQLTPVRESSPISRVTYPKIPRSSNQAVPRSPVSKVSPGHLLSPLHIKRAEVRPQDSRTGLPSYTQQYLHRREKSQQDPVTPQRQGTPNSMLSGSTLAARRQGNGAAQDLERRLHLTDYSHSRTNSNATTRVEQSEPNSGKSLHHPSERNVKAESPLKGYGRVASGGRRVSRGQLGPETKSPGPELWRSPGLPGQAQSVTLRSPLWEPKLTPSRKGDDLYLSVGVATPQTAAFTPVTEGFAH